MEEADVVVALSEYLDDSGYRFFVDSRYSQPKLLELPEYLDGCGLNSTIRIGRRVPDIIGYNTDSEIVAIEVKGENDIRKGIGQAAHYRQGVHQSFLAADATALEEFSDTIFSCGIGAYFVQSNGPHHTEVKPKEPIQNVGATELNKTQRALAIKTSSFQSDRSAFSSSTMPINAFLPVLMIAKRAPSKKVEKAVAEDDIATHEHGLSRSTSAHTFALAQTLQLIELSSRDPVKYELTDNGRIGYYLLKGKVEEFDDWQYGIDQNQIPSGIIDRILSYLTELKKRSQFKSERVYENDTEVAAFLRNQYLTIPDVRQLTRVLAAYNGHRAELSRILAEVALHTPEVFLNLFAQSNREKEFRELIDKSTTNPENGIFQQDILKLASPDYLYNFVSQLIHVGILTSESNPLHQEDDPSQGTHYWVWDNNTIGDIGVRAHGN